MKQINHGLPATDFFVIAQPPSVAKPTVDSLEPGYIKPKLELKDPKSSATVLAEITSYWTFRFDELHLANDLCLLGYGIPAEKLFPVLKRRYPEIEKTEKVRFLLLKKL